jgi:hypothetical protein
VIIKGEKYEITIAKVANKNLMSALAVTFVDSDWRYVARCFGQYGRS